MSVRVRLYEGDCLKILEKMKPKSVNLIITSPPYEDVSGAGYGKKTKDILFFKLYSDFLDEWFTKTFRVLENNGQLFLNLKSKTHNKTLRTPHWIEFLDSFNKFKFKSFIIWKYAGSFDSSNKRFHLDYEIIYHLSKGDAIFFNENCGINDPLSSVWYIPHTIKKRVHPTQMPKALASRILDLVAKKNDVVLDPFCGSGTTLKCAIEKNLDCIGIEINPKYVSMMKQDFANKFFIDFKFIEFEPGADEK